MRHACVATVLVFLLILSAQAQYFGQNKVQYHDYDFKILKTPHFDIYYYSQEERTAEQAGRMAERWYARLSQVFQWQLSSRQPVILYANAEDFRSTNVIPGEIGEATGGVTEPLRRRVVLPLAGPLAETDHVLGHELVHAFQYDMGSHAPSAPGNGGMGGAVEALPLWFIEGMAEYLSLGPADVNTAMWMRDAVLRGNVPSLKDLNNPEYFPYRWGQAFWAFIGGRYGDRTVGEMMKAASRNGSANRAVETVLHLKPEALSEQWRSALLQQYKPVLQRASPVAEIGRRVITQPKRGSEINVSPALSPDGKHIMFLSARGLFAIDLYLANAETGAIEKKITANAVNPHFNSLEFVNSAGAWSRDGRYFAYGHVEGGKAKISLYDINAGSAVRTITLPQVGEVFSPTFSPDARQIAFSALTGGITDLYVMDVASGRVRQLTHDDYADLEPAWSPDGGKIAFVTDRFGTDLNDLSYGRYRLALIDPASGGIREVPVPESGKTISPQWSPDGDSLFFVSDHDGIDNLYRVSLANGQTVRLTNVPTGISGITALSPAITVAARTGQLAFSLFYNQGYEIQRIDSPASMSGTPPSQALAELGAGVLPPRKDASGYVAALLNDARFGLPSTSPSFRVAKYEPHLSLDYVEPASVGVGTSSFGTIAGGGTALHFSDMLNTQELTTAIETSLSGQGIGDLARNFTGMAQYLNQRHRWSWGFVGGQIPFVSGTVAQDVATVGGTPALVQQQILFWQINRQAAAIAQYPFSRAQRLEFAAGWQNISFTARAQTQAFAPDGSLLLDQSQDVPTPNSLNMGNGTAALVYDTSVFGGTAPVMGQRYRFEGGIAGGSLNFGTLLADYRRYFSMARPLSFAGRILHYGRYGGGADDPRLQNLFIGYPDLVRGYSPGSFSAKECGPTLQTNGSCPIFDNLVGSRIAVANAELRLALLGPLGVIPSFKFPPVTLAGFFDGGVAWTGADKASFLGGSRSGVSSEGVALQVNLLWFAVGQVSLAHANDRPLKPWIWQFSLLPGF